MLGLRCPAVLRFALLLTVAAVLPGEMEQAADDSDSTTSFQISVNQAVRPGETVQVQLNGTRIRQLQFRLYRVADPIALFSQLDETNSFGAAYKPVKKPKTFLEKFNAFRRSLRADLLDIVRLQFTAEHRAVIRASRLQGEQKKLAQARVDAIQRSRKITGDFYANVPLVNPQRLIAVWQYNAPKTKDQWQSDTVPVKLDAAGVYLLEATDAKKQAQLILFASRMVLLARGEHGQFDLRAVDATSGEPRSGVEVRLFDPKNKAQLGVGTTSADGLCSFALPAAPENGFLALARRDSDFAAVSMGGWPIQPEPVLLQGAVYTDRPIYRPGHEVKLKAIVRDKSAGGFRIPDDREVRIAVNNSEGKPILTRSAKLSDFGTIATELKLPDSTPTGTYSVEVSQAGSAEVSRSVYGTFTVDEYRKPEYEVRLVPASARILQASSQRITLDARYYYGEPVRAGTVQWHVYRTRWYPPWAVDMEDEPDEGGGYQGEELQSAKAQLGADGKAVFDLRLALEENDQLYSVVADVMDSSGRTVSGRTAFLATVGPFYVSAEPARYVFARGESAALRVTTTDYDGNPAPNAPFTAEVSLNKWHKETGLLGSGKVTTTSQLVDTVRGQTGRDGHGDTVFVPREPGSYSVAIHATAPGGRSVHGHTFFSVSGNGESWGGEEGLVRILPDKRSYKPGETARLLVVTGTPGCWVWMSVESRAVRWQKWIHLKEAAEMVEVPIQADWTPNVFAQAYAVRDGRFLRGSKLLSVPPADKTLAVKVTPAKREFRPGEPARYDIEARDSAGRPVQAEVSLGVVDEPIYALERDPLPNLVKAFYDREWNQVTSGSSLQWYFYASAGHRSLKLAGLRSTHTRFGQLKPDRPTAPRIRKNFPDTAFWVADLNTGADGHARVQFAFPDSLTTWRATARAVTRDTLLGSAVDKVLVRKRLVLSFATPRFAVEGDKVTVPVLVRNYLNRTQNVKLSLKVSGADMEATPPEAFDIQPNGEARFEWKLKAKAASEIRLSGKAEAQDESDGLEIAFPVEPWGLPWHSGVSAALGGKRDTRSLALVVPASVRSESLHTMLSVAPSVAAEMLGSLEFLSNYPYGCTEQTLSSFLPNLVVRGVMKDLGAAGVDDATLGKMIRSGVKRLIDFQNDKGGWGFWRGDDTDPFLTAYAVWGLSLEAQLRGEQTPYPATRGAELLTQSIQQDGEIEPDLLAWEMHAISQAGVLQNPLLERLWDVRRKLSPQGLALLGTVLVQRKDRRAAEIAAQLEGLVRKDHRGASWSVDHDLFEPWSRDAGVEATAFALRFLAQHNPTDPLLSETARWLAGSRDSGPAWNTTKRTAFALYGLTEYLRVSKELQPSFKITAYGAGRKIFEKSFSSADVFSPPPQVEVPAGVSIEIRKEGAGTAYVSLDGSARLAGDRLEMPASGSGFEISRELYRLVPTQAGGRMTQTLVPLQGPVHVGEIVMLRLTVSALRDQRYLLIDSPLPAGAEPVTRDEVYDIQPQPPWWKLSWSRRELRDSHALWFPWALQDGPALYSAMMRFTNPGTYRLGAARVEAMYQPGLFRATDQVTLEVVEP